MVPNQNPSQKGGSLPKLFQLKIKKIADQAFTEVESEADTVTLNLNQQHPR